MVRTLDNNWILKALSTSITVGLVLSSHLSQAAIYDSNGNKLPDTEVNSSIVNWQLLKAKESKKYNGVGLLESNSSRFCTAFFINTGNQPKAPAYAITNGHCYNGSRELLGANEIIVNQPSNLVFSLNYFISEEKRIHPVHVRRVAYATIKNTDIAILELNTTFNQLVKAGFTPLTIHKAQVQAGESVEVIGIPLAEVDSSQSFLHRSVCQTGQLANVREDIYHWNNSIRNHCSVVGGMSGSPMISLKNNRVVGILNTGVDDQALKQPECSLNRPCEISKNGKIATFPNENYAQQVSKIPNCFNRKGIFNLNLKSCGLEKP